MDQLEQSNLNKISPSFWSVSVNDLMTNLQTSPQSLTREDARQRLVQFGENLLRPKKQSNNLLLFVSQFKSPIVLILIFAAGLSFFLRDAVDAIIILTIVFISSLLGFWQEKSAANAVEKLLAIVQTKTVVLRDGSPSEIPVEEVVRGDVVILSAGASIPGDCVIIESKDLYLNEAALTGETYPAGKMAGTLQGETPLGKRTNCLFMGTHVVSGTATALVVNTGKATEFGKVSERLKLRPPETEFERGIRRFGFFLMEVTLLLVIAIFASNVFLSKPVMDAFLFSLAIAVGLTPQLLPAIISVNLSHGASHMAQEKVIVRRLSSIEDFGSMNVLCSDKTGTLTEGIVSIHSALDVHGNSSENVLLHAYLNAFHETGFANPIDEAIRSYRKFDVSGYRKLDELPYDFIRKRLSILLSDNSRHIMVTKGALQNVLAVCSVAENAAGESVPLAQIADEIQQHYEAFSGKGFRTLGIAYREVGVETTTITRDHEVDMTFIGFLVLHDPPKAGIVETVRRLKNLGIRFKVITGDNQLVAANLSQQVGMAGRKILTGSDLRQMNDEALTQQVNDVDVFAEVEPNQKERIIIALKKAGNVVGYMGDGINDASALHAADVGLSVDTAVDVAKDAADIVLLDKDLGVLEKGVFEGRKTFANTLKYVFMATSANFGNMFSMAGASLFLPFLPLLPKQILLTNLMTDFPEMTISTDSVDAEMIEKPRRWNIKFIRQFMITFGILSSLFDYITFGILLFFLKATTIQFRTAWFLESIVSASLIVLVIRSRKPFFKSAPGKYLLIATLAISVFTIIFPFSPLGKIFGFGPLPLGFLLIIGVIVAVYIFAAEVVKREFFKRVRF